MKKQKNKKPLFHWVSSDILTSMPCRPVAHLDFYWQIKESMVDICAYVFCHLVPKQFAFLHSKLTVYYPIGEIKWISKALLGVQMILWAIARKGKLWKVDFNLTTILFQLICFYLYLETCDFFSCSFWI